MLASYKFPMLGNYLTMFCDDDDDFPLSIEHDEISYCGDPISKSLFLEYDDVELLPSISDPIECREGIATSAPKS